MTKSAIKWMIALFLSFMVHAGVAGWFNKPTEAVELAGAAVSQVAVLGNSFADSIASGAITETTEPIEPQVTPTKPQQMSRLDPIKNIEALEAATDIPTAAKPASHLQTPQPVTRSETAHPSTQSGAATPSTNTLLPETRTVELVKPKETGTLKLFREKQAELKPVDAPEIAMLTPEPEAPALTTIPVPSPRREVKPAQPPNNAEKPRKRETVKKPEPVRKQPERQTVRKKPSSGNEGNSKATAKKGVSDGSKSARSSAKSRNKKGSRRSGNAAVSNYPGKVQRKVNRSKVKPRSKRARGKVVIAFVVSKSGAVSGVRIARGSGNPEVDAAAMRSVKRAAPFPRIPDEAGRSRWAFNVPMVYR